MPQGMHNTPGSPRPRLPPIDVGSLRGNTHSVQTRPVTTLPEIAQPVDVLWNAIEQHRSNAAPTYFANAAVEPNHTGVRCPNNADTLQVQLGDDKNNLTPIHANFVRLDKCYAVGQSPGGVFEKSCTHDLIQSLDSGQGLFQFTSRKPHRILPGSQHERATPTVAHMLTAQWEASGAGMRLGTRYEVKNFCLEPDDPPRADVVRYRLEAYDRLADKTRTVFITEARLRFVNKLLRPQEIIRAAELLETHPSALQERAAEEAPSQTGPLICSAAGIGRSAVLAVYQDLSKRLSTDVNRDNLDQKLEEAIKKGIDARGPKFLHSKAQLAALREELLAQFASAQVTHRSPSAERRTRQHLSLSSAGSASDFDAVAATTSTANNAPPLTLAELLAREMSGSQAEPHADLQAQSPTAHQSAVQSNTSTGQHTERDLAPRSAPASPVSQSAQASTQAGEHAAAQTQSVSAPDPSPPVLAATAQAPILTTSDATITRLPGRALVVKADGDWQTSFPPVSSTVAPVSPHSAPVNKQLFKVNWPQWGARSSYGSFKPLNRYTDYLCALRTADQMHLPSIAFSSELIVMEPSSRDGASQTEPAPLARAAALAVVAMSEYIRTRAKTLKAATFHCATEVQKRVYDDLLGRVDRLTHPRVVDALLRPTIEHRSTPTEPEKFFEEGQVATYVPPEINHNADNCAEIITPPRAPQGALHGVPFAPWIGAPTSVRGWNAAADQVTPGFSEPDAPPNLRAAGAVIVEKDSRVWVVAPTNQFCKLKNTFPKGQIDEAGLTARGCAVKEAYEESGLQIRLTRHLADSSSGSTRYYLAERIGGTPADVGWESQAVSLVPQSELGQLFDDGDERYNHQRERVITAALQQQAPLRADEPSSEGPRMRAAPRVTGPDYLRLMNELAENEGVQTFSRDINERIRYAMFEMATEPNRIARNQRNVALHGSSLSKQINNVMNKWRADNCVLIENDAPSRSRAVTIFERQSSHPPHALTALRGIGNGAAPYLHANHIPLDCSIAFIAAQRPLSNPAPGVDNSNTFWRTLLHENIGLIVDLTEADEKPDELPYGPYENTEKNIGTHTLRLTSGTTTNAPLRAEQIDVRDASNQRARTLTRLHFTGWKDNTAITADALIALAEQVVDTSRKRPGRVLMHSSHGVGRAGTLITFIAASEQVERALVHRAGMPIEKLTQLVTDIVVSGRIERGPDFVSAVQFPVIIEALLKKHFGGVEGDFLTAKKSAD